MGLHSKHKQCHKGIECHVKNLDFILTTETIQQIERFGKHLRLIPRGLQGGKMELCSFRILTLNGLLTLVL